MQIHLIAIGTKMPSWVSQGVLEYSKRLPSECRLNLVEIPASVRGKNADIKRAIRDEGKRMLKAIPKRCRVVALEVEGKSHSTESLAKTLRSWLEGGQDVAILIGGPEGLSEDCRARADSQWSLSKLTLPHPIVRIVTAEALYRAWSVVKNHPYHRA